jgi:hypothetical protein
MSALVEALTVLAAIFAAVQLLALMVLHALPTGYEPIRDAVSDYGVGRYRAWFWAQVIAGGLACLFLAIALTQLQPYTPIQAIVALIVTAAARLAIPFFATDQGGNRFETAHGTVHMILAVLAFGGLVWAASSLWSTLNHYPAWQGAEGVLSIVPWIMLGCVIVVVLAIRGPNLKPFFGLFERLFYLASFVWFFVVAIDLARIYGLDPPSADVPRASLIVSATFFAMPFSLTMREITRPPPWTWNVVLLSSRLR